MTRLLEEAIKKVSQLPASMQDHIGAAMLEELNHDLAWEATLRRPASLALLDDWATEALADLKGGETSPLDPDDM